jgi:transcriptional regulator of acetoin/glycerol metabolism
MGRSLEPLSEEDILRLKSYHWPGNVRELQNVIERAVITSREGRLNLDSAFPKPVKDAAVGNVTLPSPTKQILTMQQIEQLERENLILALEATGWRVSGEKGAARLLGINASTLSSRLKALGIMRLGQNA